MSKEREAFEAWLFREYPDAIDFIIIYRPDENIYEHRPTQARWEAWQAAKAQVVPEGFVLVPKHPTRKMMIASSGWDQPHLIYKAMLAAAQESSSTSDCPDEP